LSHITCPRYCKHKQYFIMNTLIETIGAIAAKDYRNTKVFRQLGINFVYAGNKTLEEASKDAGVAVELVKVALEQNSLTKPTIEQEFNKWDIDLLIDYIVSAHHLYTKESAVIIYDLAQNISYSHSQKHPALKTLAAALFLFLDDLLYHLKKEEQILFPNIRQLVKNRSCNERFTYTTFGFINEIVGQLKKEHLAAGNELKLFRQLTNDYLLPADAGISYKYLFQKMKEFESDLFLHVHLENNILFPKALNLDDELNLEKKNFETGDGNHYSKQYTNLGS
jgi:regulator of cell morphogenesis and NO signaling